MISITSRRGSEFNGAEPGHGGIVTGRRRRRSRRIDGRSRFPIQQSREISLQTDSSAPRIQRRSIQIRRSRRTLPRRRTRFVSWEEEGVSVERKVDGVLLRVVGAVRFRVGADGAAEHDREGVEAGEERERDREVVEGA